MPDQFPQTGPVPIASQHSLRGVGRRPRSPGAVTAHWGMLKELRAGKAVVFCAAGGQSAPLWASLRLQRTAALCLEHLLPSCSTDLGGCRTVSLILLLSFLKSEHTQYCSWLISGSGGSLLKQLELALI